MNQLVPKIHIKLRELVSCTNVLYHSCFLVLLHSAFSK